MNRSVFEQLNIKWIILIGCVVHLPMLSNGFTYYSDDVYVLNNILVHKINAETIAYIFTSYFDGHYHPLTLLSLAFTYSFSGTNALGYQLTNLIFHLISCWLIYRILLQLELKKAIVSLSTFVFAIHPLNVESVALITERKDTQYVLFLLMALYFFTEFLKDPAKRKFYLFSLICFFLSLLSKGQAVVFPLILYAISWYRFKTKSEPVRHLWIAPLFILSAFFVYLNYRAQLVTGYLSETEAITLKQVLIYPATIISSYAVKLFLPFNLSAQYPIPKINVVSFIYVAVVICLVIAFYFLLKRKKYLSVLGILLYVVSVFPMLRIVPVSENFMPDRYNYLGLVGFGIFISSICFDLPDRLKKYNVQLFLLVWLVLLAGMCFKRTTIWKEGFTIWEDAYKKQPDDEFASLNYGTYLANTKRDVNEGLKLCRKSIEMNPGNIVTRVNFVGVLSGLGKKEESLMELRGIINAKPLSASNISNRAVIMMQYGRARESAKEFDRAVYLKPSFAKNRINRAGYYYNQFMFEQALAELDTLESLHSNYIETICMMRIRIYTDLGKPELAQKGVNRLRALGAEPKQLTALQEKISQLQDLIPQNEAAMSPEMMKEYASLLYSKKLFYQAHLIFKELLKKNESDEKLLNNAMACAFNLSRPDLMLEYVKLLKTCNYEVNPNALNYLNGLGLL